MYEMNDESGIRAIPMNGGHEKERAKSELSTSTNADEYV